MSPARVPELGLFLSPEAARYPEVRRQVGVAEAGGLDFAGIQDHPYQARFLDAFALIGDLLARTDRMRFFPAVANLPLRHPAMLATLGASLDVMSAGRFELGIGAGAFPEAVAAMGGPQRSPGAAVDALEEAIEILRRAWGGERSIDAEGRHYRLRGFHPGPPPVHDIGIWVGAYKPRMLALTGRLGDGWLPSHSYAPPKAIPEMRARIDETAERAGRDPAAIRRIYNVTGRIADERSDGDGLYGPPAFWIETLRGYVDDLGFDGFLFWPDDDDPVGQTERFAAEVAPGVREGYAA